MEVITWLDDCTRYALHVSAHGRVTAQIVLATFREAAGEHGYPASTLTDNGMVYTVRFASRPSGRNHLEQFSDLKVGSPVEFTPSTNDKGQVRAMDVVLTEPSFQRQFGYAQVAPARTSKPACAFRQTHVRACGAPHRVAHIVADGVSRVFSTTLTARSHARVERNVC